MKRSRCGQRLASPETRGNPLSLQENPVEESDSECVWRSLVGSRVLEHPKQLLRIRVLRKASFSGILEVLSESAENQCLSKVK